MWNETISAVALDAKVTEWLMSTFPDIRDSKDKVTALSIDLKLKIANLVNPIEWSYWSYEVTKENKILIEELYTAHLQWRHIPEVASF